MAEQDEVEMDIEECHSFLGLGGTGVISLSTSADSPPHSLPVSYGFDESDSAFYFRIAVGPDSEKGELDDRSVTFVVYDDQDGFWKRVNARGRLESIDERNDDMELLEGFEHVEIPYVDIFGRPSEELTFEFYRLVPDELSGYRAVELTE